jgi:hypothetical protein
MEQTLQIVSCEQAKRLQALGYEGSKSCLYFYTTAHTFKGYKEGTLCPAQIVDVALDNGESVPFDEHLFIPKESYIAPYTSEALRWLRNTKELQHYGGTYYEKDKYVFWWRFRSEDLWDRTKIYDSYEEAESALLDAMLTVLEKGDAQ